MEPLDRSTIWPYDERGEPGEFYYSRYGNPTVAEAERRLGELDGGTALLYPSGSGATTALALALLKPGDTIALAAGCYFGTGVTFQTLERWGLRYAEPRRSRASTPGRRHGSVGKGARGISRGFDSPATQKFFTSVVWFFSLCALRWLRTLVYRRTAS